MTPVPRRHEILDVPVDSVDLDGAVDRIAEWLRMPEPGLRHVVTVNPEFVIAVRHDPSFREVLRKASLSTADGIGIILAARILSLPVRDRVSGVDLVDRLAARSPENCRMFFLGAAQGVAAQAQRVLEGRYPRVRIAGSYSGSPGDEDFGKIERELKAARPTVLLVAFGHPRQDLWIDRHRERLDAHGILIAVGVGGTFDYLSGRVPRAPYPVRRLGLEWLFRLVRQPQRWRRQLALPLFVVLVLRERFRRGRRRNLETS
jgi:N-acetylglucosaminyldiphosphoundecaprenol N-acetyl-beta-D-mannosaminyltransferase